MPQTKKNRMPKTQETPVCVYDFTLSCAKFDRDQIIQVCKTIAKKWCFQKELGKETGFAHYQGRLSLKVKGRIETLSKAFKMPKECFSITSEENRTNLFYVTKTETRVEGPWSDEDPYFYIPRQIREIHTLYDWQQHIVNSAQWWDTRSINILYCPNGNIGKSILKTYIGCHQIGRALPYSNDYRDIMRMVMDTPKKPLYIIDLPRAIAKDRLYQFFSAVETIKDGYAFDDRYNFKEEYFDCPTIWIFMNEFPELDLLSRDRWKIWVVKHGTIYEKNLGLMDTDETD